MCDLCTVEGPTHLAVIVALSTLTGTVVSELPLTEQDGEPLGAEAVAGQLARQLLLILPTVPDETDRRWSAAWAVRRGVDGRGTLARALGAQAREERLAGRQGLATARRRSLNGAA